jgi:hypothetical protein
MQKGRSGRSDGSNSEFPHPSRVTPTGEQAVTGLQPEVDWVGWIMRYEQDGLEEGEEVEFFQYLLDSGVVWGLQGSYQRRLNDLVADGLVKVRP